MATLKGDFTSTNKEISQVQAIVLCNAVKKFSVEKSEGFCTATFA